MKNKLNLNSIKYVYFDLDGTLLTSKKIPSLKTVEMIKKLEQKEIKCSIATGRPYFYAQNEIKIINPLLPVISCNGALMFDPIKKQVISFNEINSSKAQNIYNILIKNDAVFVLYTKEQIFMYKNNLTNPESRWLTLIKNINENFPEESRVKITIINEPEKFNITQFNIIKFLIIYSEIPAKKYQVIENEVSKISDVYIVRSQNEVFDIMPNNQSKGNGLQKLHDQGIINLNETLVFGDAENDLSMFQVAKWSVAMGNAQDKTKKIATFITKSNDEDGIATFFENLVLD